MTENSFNSKMADDRDWLITSWPKKEKRKAEKYFCLVERKKKADEKSVAEKTRISFEFLAKFSKAREKEEERKMAEDDSWRRS